MALHKEQSEPVSEPISHGVVAETHEAIYKMHKYFARRPGNVFNYLVKHYSAAGDIILDPFSGGGATVFEALREGRKVIGVDINPMAVFITEAELLEIDLEALKSHYQKIRKDLKDQVESLYMTQCDKCNQKTPVEWFEWSNVVPCKHCKSEHLVSSLKKQAKSGTYECSSCNKIIDQRDCYRLREELVKVNYTCRNMFRGNPCENVATRNPHPDDLRLVQSIESIFDTTVKSENLFYPKDNLRDGNLVRENGLFNKGFHQFKDFFTLRNLLAAALLVKRLRQIRDPEIRKILLFTFSSSLKWAAPRLCHRRDGIVEGWATHDFRIFAVFLEINFWDTFERRFQAVLRGKELSNQLLYGRAKDASNFAELLANKNWMLLAQSATNLPQIPDSSVDLVLTDPPYGGSVQYAELSDFWAIWLRPELGLTGYIDNREEAVADRHFDFEGAKNLQHYQSMLQAVLAEAWKKLRPNCWLVMTFHNRELAVWNSLLVAAHKAGFQIPQENGVIYQPPIKAYTTTSHQRRGGSVLGDFILSFRRMTTPPKPSVGSQPEVEQSVVREARKVIEYHGGASISSIYRQLIPFLTNKGILHRMAQNDLEPLLEKHFIKHQDKWYFPEHFNEKGALKPFDVIPAEQRVEQLIRSILTEKKAATLDEIYQGLYTNLVNGRTPEEEEIIKVLNRVASKVTLPDSKREVWKLGSQTSMTSFVPEVPNIGSSEDHNNIILRLAEIGITKGYECHVGEKEQRSDPRLRQVSSPMGNNVVFGILPEAWEIVKQIDLLWMKGRAIIAAFEVEKSTTINSGITRFRDLFVAQPNSNIKAIILVPESRLNEANKKVNSAANLAEGLHERVRVHPFSYLDSVDI